MQAMDMGTTWNSYRTNFRSCWQFGMDYRVWNMFMIGKPTCAWWLTSSNEHLNHNIVGVGKSSHCSFTNCNHTPAWGPQLQGPAWLKMNRTPNCNRFVYPFSSIKLASLGYFDVFRRQFCSLTHYHPHHIAGWCWLHLHTDGSSTTFPCFVRFDPFN